MTTYTITQMTSGVILGDFEAEDAEAAADAMARDAGYADFRDMCGISDPEDLDEEVEKQLGTLQIVRK